MPDSFPNDFEASWKRFMKLGRLMMDELERIGICSWIRIFVCADFRKIELQQIFGFQDGAIRMRQAATGMILHYYPLFNIFCDAC